MNLRAPLERLYLRPTILFHFGSKLHQAFDGGIQGIGCIRNLNQTDRGMAIEAQRSPVHDSQFALNLTSRHCVYKIHFPTSPFCAFRSLYWPSCIRVLRHKLKPFVLFLFPSVKCPHDAHPVVVKGRTRTINHVSYLNRGSKKSSHSELNFVRRRTDSADSTPGSMAGFGGFQGLLDGGGV